MIKILFLIDDDQDDREIFREAVAKCDPKIEMKFAKDGVEALEILNSSVTLPDVIFLDYNMPRMNGLQCLKILKADPLTKEIPTIMYTTSGDREQEKVVLLLGADYYMQKTVSFIGLCDELARLFEVIDKSIDLKELRFKRPQNR
jgi:CheY-like chemotaxis protein